MEKLKARLQRMNFWSWFKFKMTATDKHYKHKNICNLVKFTDIELKIGLVLTESGPQFIL